MSKSRRAIEKNAAALEGIEGRLELTTAKAGHLVARRLAQP